jgi:thiol-disulfide isomerase/thioredoxin
MKECISALLLIVLFLLIQATAPAAEQAAQDSKCPPGSSQVPDSSGMCPDTVTSILPQGTGGTNLLHPSFKTGEGIPMPNAPATGRNPELPHVRDAKVVIYLFWGTGCPHCEKEKRFLAEIKLTNPALEVRDYEVLYNSQNRDLLAALLKAYDTQASGVPITFIDNRVFRGFSLQTKEAMESTIQECRKKNCVDPGELLKGAERRQTAIRSTERETGVPEAASAKGKRLSVDIPLLGALDAGDTSLPVLTLVIAGMDSFNPCAFFVLLSLLGLLVHAQSRNKMLLVGGVFVFFSGFIYFLFMAAWLNLFLVMGNVAVITRIAGGVSLFIAAINIKDFFLFKKGVSLSIPERAKPQLFDRMRKLLRSTSLFSILAGTTVLAVMANSYELLCTAGFPMVFTRILTLNHLTTTSYYLYLTLYNVIYIIPLFFIVLVFTITLGSRKLSEWQGRTLKLVSGAMMLGLGGVLLVAPSLLNSVVISCFLLAGAIASSLIVVVLTRKYTAKRLRGAEAGSSR